MHKVSNCSTSGVSLRSMSVAALRLLLLHGKKALGLVLLVTMKGPSHFTTSLPRLSALCFLLSTGSPILMSLIFVFGSLYFLVCLWYASILWHAVTLRVATLISSGIMASVPYSNLKGVNLVALDSVVLCDQTTIGRSSIHFPFWWLNNIFLIVENMIPLALSTAPFDWGWQTEGYLTLVYLVLRNTKHIIVLLCILLVE